MLLDRLIRFGVVGASFLLACSYDDTTEPVGIMWGSGATGAFVEDTVPLVAFFRDASGRSVGDPLTGVAWSSSDVGVLRIDGDTIAIAVSTGVATIRGSINAPTFSIDLQFEVIPRWQGRLVWVRAPDDGGQPRLAVQDYPGHAWRQLPDFGYPLSGTGDAYLSNDGRFVLATSTRRSSALAPSTVFVMDLNADTVWAPLNALPGEQFSAAWLPDNTGLAFLAGAPTGWEVFSARLDGSDVRQITQLSQTVPPFFDVTTEGNIVLTLRGLSASSDLFEITQTGDTVRRLTTTTTYEEDTPAVSPDGAAIAYVATSVDGAGRALDASQVWVMSRNGTQARQLLPLLQEMTGRPRGNATSQSPSWSPDSRFVLLSWSVDPHRRPNGSYFAFPEVYAVRVADGLAIRLTRYADTDAQPFFR